jgi:putative resolvase
MIVEYVVSCDTMKLSQWAKKRTFNYRRTAWEHYRCGKILGAYQLETGTIIVPDEISGNIRRIYCNLLRVSSSENKSNLERQSERLIQ